jgi:uncharacterized protein YigE (DUF2233 family)
MKLLALAVFLFAFNFCRAQADWAVTNRKTAPTSSPAISHTVLTLQKDHAIEVHVITFDAARARLRVIDQPDERGRLDATASAIGALAAVNGGYFHPDRMPLGLVIPDGRKLHGFEKAKLLSGLVVSTGSKTSLLRASDYKPATKYDQALQAGPFLVDGGKPVAGLNNSRRARRTVVAAYGKGKIALIVTGSVTLAECADLLMTPNLLGESKITRALNLDGGSSTALWVNTGAAPYYQPEWGSVRNYLAIVPK